MIGKDKPRTSIGDQAFVGILARIDKGIQYEVYIYYFITDKIYVSSVYKNRKEVDWRVHHSPDEVKDCFREFFGEREISTLKFRNE